MRFIAVILIYGAAGLAALYDFIWGACLFLWNNIFRPLEFSYHGGSFPAAQYVFVILVLSYLISFGRGLMKPKMNFMIAMGGIFLGWLLICSWLSPFQDSVWGEYFNIIKYLLPLMLISSGLVLYRSVIIVTFCVLVSVGVWSAQGGVKGLVSGIVTNMAIPGGQMTDNNDFMAVSVGILPLLLHFARYYTWNFPKVVRRVLLLMFFLTIAAVIFSHSRGAVIGVLGLVIGYVILGSSKKLRDATLSFVFLLCVGSILPSQFWERMQTIEISLTHQSEASAENRLKMMRAALDCALENPLFGVGPNSWINIAEKYTGERTEPHSIYLKLASEVGFPGLMIFLFLIFVTCHRLHIIKNKMKKEVSCIEKANFSIAMMLSIIGTAISFAFLNHPYSEFFWTLLCIANAFIAQFNTERDVIAHKEKFLSL